MRIYVKSKMNTKKRTYVQFSEETNCEEPSPKRRARQERKVAIYTGEPLISHISCNNDITCDVFLCDSTGHVEFAAHSRVLVTKSPKRFGAILHAARVCDKWNAAFCTVQYDKRSFTYKWVFSNPEYRKVFVSLIRSFYTGSLLVGSKDIVAYFQLCERFMLEKELELVSKELVESVNNEIASAYLSIYPVGASCPSNVVAKTTEQIQGYINKDPNTCTKMQIATD